MFDIAIVGLGASGGALLLELLQQNYKGSIVIIEQKTTFANDKTWSFWEKGFSTIDEVVYKVWDKAKFYSKKQQREFNLSPYVYKTIRSIDFYHYLLKKIKQETTITFLQEEVIGLTEANSEVLIDTTTNHYLARRVFDSRPPLLKNNKKGVLQHFLGQVVQTKQNAFDSTSFTMMDFRLNESNTTSFMYVLPYTKTEALVEFTYFSNNLPQKETYRKYITQYCNQILQIDDYTVQEEEYGVIPMLMQDFAKESTSKIIRIGTAGGVVKPSSGYSFQHSRKRAKYIVRQLLNNETIALNNTHKRHHFYDEIFVSILEDYNHVGEQLFSTMYTKNNIETTFRFLDEETSFTEELSVIRTFACSKQMPLFIRKMFATF